MNIQKGSIWNLKEAPHPNLTMLAPWLWTFHFYKSEKKFLSLTIQSLLLYYSNQSVEDTSKRTGSCYFPWSEGTRREVAAGIWQELQLLRKPCREAAKSCELRWWDAVSAKLCPREGKGELEEQTLGSFYTPLADLAGSQWTEQTRLHRTLKDMEAMQQRGTSQWIISLSTYWSCGTGKAPDSGTSAKQRWKWHDSCERRLLTFWKRFTQVAVKQKWKTKTKKTLLF